MHLHDIATVAGGGHQKIMLESASNGSYSRALQQHAEGEGAPKAKLLLSMIQPLCSAVILKVVAWHRLLFPGFFHDEQQGNMNMKRVGLRSPCGDCS